MIVDIIIPSISKSYEFNIDEDKEISIVINEIADAICRKDDMSLKGDISYMLLLSKDNKSILNKYQTLASAGIKSGDTLIIV